MHSLQTGEILDNRYRLESFVGQGGFAEVWKVTDTETDTVHALKIFAPDQKMSDDGIRLFKRDYRLTSGLRHSALLTPTHYSVHNGSPFLIMPLCKRGSLDVQLQEGPLSEPELARVIEQVCSGLAYMHALDPPIVHRDIKTENVLVDDQGEYLITDFGISSAAQQTLKKVTRSQQAVSVSYAPPERFESTPKSLPSGDIFSLGVMLYELCTRELPWDGNGGLLLNAGAQIPDLPAHYPKRLNTIVRACLNPNYELRPTARELKKWAVQYQTEQLWPDIPEKYKQVAQAPKSSGGGRKTQRMEDIEIPDSAGFGTDTSEPSSTAKPQGQPAPKDDKPSPSRKKDDAGSSAKRMGLLVVFLVLAVVGFFGYEHFMKKDPQPPLKSDLGLSSEKKDKENAGKVAKLIGGEKEGKEESLDTRSSKPEKPDTPKPDARNTREDPPQKSTPAPIESAPVEKKGKSYREVGSLTGVFAELSKGDLPYGQKKKLKQELLGFFTSPENAVVVTSVQGTPTDAESAAAFSSRIITMPKPSIQVLSMEKDGDKIKKLVVEID